MVWGIEAKNRSGAVLFSTVHESFKKVASGYQKPYFVNSATGIKNNLHHINFPSGVSRSNAIIFARPNIYNEETQRLQGYWPMGVQFSTDTFQGQEYFRITAPDDSVSYYRSRTCLGYSKFLDGLKTLNTSSDHWGVGVNGIGALGDVYYEIWAPGTSSAVSVGDETVSYGLEVRTHGTDRHPGTATFGSNRQNFKVEQSSYVQQSVDFFASSLATNNRVNYINMTPQRLFFQNKSNTSQGQYMAILNGSAHTSGIIKGGNVDTVNSLGATAYEIPGNMAGFYNSFVEFHYYDEDNIYGFQPAVVQIPRLLEAKNTSEDVAYNAEPRYLSSVGVKTLALIGKSL